jgi:CheY-like chemotaxis protein
MESIISRAFPANIEVVTDYRADMYAIITDFHMPHIGGLVFLRLPRQILPEIPLIVTSGNLEQDDLSKLKNANISSVIEKPFTREAWAENLAKIGVIQSW